MNQNPRLVGAGQPPLFEQPLHKGDGPQFAQQRRVETDLVDPVLDLLRGDRHLIAFQRVDVHDDDVVWQVVSEQREQRRVTGIAPVPIGLPPPGLRIVDLDRLKHRRQAGRGKDRIGRDLVMGKDPDLAGSDGSRAYIKLRPLVGTDIVKVQRLDQRLHRVAIERPIAIGRNRARHRIGPRVKRRQFQRLCERSDGRRPEPFRHARQIACPDTAPDRIETGARPVAPACQYSRLVGGTVQRPGRGAGNSGDLDVFFIQQPVENTPCERPVRTATLQGEIDPFHSHQVPFHL